MGTAVPADDLPEVKAVPVDDLPESYRPVSAAQVVRAGGALGRKAAEAARMALAQRDEGVDYSGIPDLKAQAAYSLLQKPEDRTEYLRRRFGPDNVTKDSFGKDVVIQNGKKISFVPKEDGKNVGAQWAGVAGEIAPTLGMIAGGVAGAPLGPIGGATFSAAGGGAGVAANQLIARAAGLPVSQDSTEAAQDIVTGGMVPGALGEGVARGLGFAGRTALGPYLPGSLFGPWERTRALWEQQMADVAKARDLGLRPHVGTAAPNARLLQRFQGMANRIFGDEAPLYNRPVLEKNVADLQGQGAPAELSNPEALNYRLSRKTDQVGTAAQTGADTARADAEKVIQDAQRKLSEDVGAPSGQLASKVAEDIRGFREQFGQKASELYKPIDEFAGKPMVPTAGLKQQLAQAMEQNPLLKPNDVFAKQIASLPDHVTFQQMQNIRATLYSESDFGALNSGLTNRDRIRLANAADSSFDEAGQAFTQKRTRQVVGPNGETLTETVNVPANEQAQSAVQALRRADQFYKAGIKRFDEISSQALVKDATQTGFIEPEKVARYIATPGQTDKLLRIKRVVKPETFAEVGKETWAMTLRDSTDPLTGQVDGRKLANRLNDLSKNRTLDVLFGEQAPSMRKLAQSLAALDGKVPVESLQQGDIRTSIEKALIAQRQADALMKSDWMRAIKTDGPRSLQAADWLTRPDNRLQLRNALQTFGADSGEGKALREYLARRIFSTMEVPASRGAEKYMQTELMGEPLLKELNSYGKPYLEEVFGKEWTDKAYGFAKAAEVATRKNPTDAGGIVSAAIAVRPLKNIGRLAEFFTGGELLSTPAVLDYLSKGVANGRLTMNLRDVLMQGTRVESDIQSETRTRSADEYARGVKNKVQSQLK